MIGIIVSVKVDTDAGAVAGVSILSPHSVAVPGVDVAVGVDAWHDDEGDVVEVLVELAIADLVHEPLAVRGRDPFSSVDSAIDGHNLGARSDLNTEKVTALEGSSVSEIAVEGLRVRLDCIVVVVLEEVVSFAVVSREHGLDVDLFLEILDGNFVVKIVCAEDLLELVGEESRDLDVGGTTKDELVDALGRPKVEVHHAVESLERGDLADAEVVKSDDLKMEL